MTNRNRPCFSQETHGRYRDVAGAAMACIRRAHLTGAAVGLVSLPIASCGFLDDIVVVTPPTPRIFGVMAPDVSGSYITANGAAVQSQMARVVREDLQPGDRIVGRLINARSGAAAALLFDIEIPYEDHVNPFDPTAKERQLRVRTGASAVVDSAVAKLDTLAKFRSSRTDLVGFLGAVERDFQSAREALTRSTTGRVVRLVLVIFSDLQDTSGQQLPAIDLTGVQVRIVNFDDGGDTGEGRRRAQEWTDWFIARGATDVRFTPPGVAFRLAEMRETISDTSRLQEDR